MNFKRLLKPILVILAILILTLSVSAGDLYSTYGQRIKLTIDHTKIDADLGWFPVTVFLGNYGDAIDVGAEAIDMGTYSSEHYTYINQANPANASGKITSVEIYAYANLTGAIVATFYRPDPTGQPNYLVSRDSYEIGSVTAGSKQTFTVDLNVEEGDYLGIYSSVGRIERDGSGGDGVWQKFGDYTQTTGDNFTPVIGWVLSLYATGFEKSQGTEVFAEFDADEDFDRIAFTSSDGETQLYADCELFDTTNGVAIYHVSKDGWTISSSADTDFYMYYDSTAGHNYQYIGRAGEVSNFDDYTNEYDGSALPTASTPAWDVNVDAGASEADYASVSGGILTIDTSTASSEVCYYSRTPDIDFDAGIYIKIRAKTFAGHDYTYCDIRDGTQNERIRFYIEDTDISITGSDRTIVAATTSDDYHIYEVYIKGTTTKLYMDGVLKITHENVGSGTFSDTILFGDGSGTGKVNIGYDYFNYALDVSYDPCVVYTNVWDSSFEAVYHMNDNTTSTILDSTSNANHGTKKGVNEPAEATGLVGKGQDFDGTDDYITLPNFSLFDGTKNFTVEAIVNADSVPASDDWANAPVILSFRGEGAYQITYDDSASNPDRLSSRANLSVSSWTTLVESTRQSIDTDYFHATTFDTTNGWVWYENGSSQDTNANTESFVSSSDINYIGWVDNGTNRHFNGIIDETRISSTARSAAWSAGTNSSLRDTLLTYSAKETGGGETPEEATNVLFIFSNF